MLPNARSKPLIPREIVSGERINFQTEISIPLGAAVLCPVASTKNLSDQKQEIGVCMGPSLNIKGGVRVYLLNKSVPRIRRIFKQLRMPKHVIDHMNDYAAAEVRAVGKTTAELERDGDMGADPFYRS